MNMLGHALNKLVKDLRVSLAAMPVDPYRRWRFLGHRRQIEVHVPLVIREGDETCLWINLARSTGDNPHHNFDIIVMTGGPLTMKDGSSAEWVRRLELQMSPGDHRDLILNRDPDWQVPANSVFSFVYHGSLVVESLELGDSFGVDLEIERGLLSVIRSSLKSLSGLVSTLSAPALLSIIKLFEDGWAESGLLARLATSFLIFTATYMVIWGFLSLFKRPWELNRRLQSNEDYLRLLARQTAVGGKNTPRRKKGKNERCSH